MMTMEDFPEVIHLQFSYCTQTSKNVKSKNIWTVRDIDQDLCHEIVFIMHARTE